MLCYQRFSSPNYADKLGRTHRVKLIKLNDYNVPVDRDGLIEDKVEYEYELNEVGIKRKGTNVAILNGGNWE